MEENKIEVCTTASDAEFSLTSTSLFSFLKNNQWFSGKVLLLLHPSFPLSDANLTKLKSIYSNLETIHLWDLEPLLYVNRSTRPSLAQLSDFSKVYIFSLASHGLLYFSNRCLFNGEITHFLDRDTISFSPEESIIYIGSNFSLPIFEEFLQQSLQVGDFFKSRAESLSWNRVEGKTLDASSIQDAKFPQLLPKIQAARCLYYGESPLVESKKHEKTRRIWLHANRIVEKYLSSPKNINLEKKFINFDYFYLDFDFDWDYGI